MIDIKVGDKVKISGPALAQMPARDRRFFSGKVGEVIDMHAAEEVVRMYDGAPFAPIYCSVFHHRSGRDIRDLWTTAASLERADG